MIANKAIGNIVEILKDLLRPIWRLIKESIQKPHIKRETNRLLDIIPESNVPRVFYLGITEHSNLGDLAQYYCIKRWLKMNFFENEIIEFESTTVVDKRFGFIDKFRKVLGENDIIVFQSGYTTQDLGGNHEYMHRLIIDNFPTTKIILMPQTIFFREEKNKLRTAVSYNQGKRTIFLARDRVSYEMAIEMFPDIVVKLYPDIVTSLIGQFKFDQRDNKVLFCCRNDGEKLYSDEEILQLRNRVEGLLPTEISDTTIRVSHRKIRRNLKYYIENEIEKFSKYRLIITDRYHGNIFALAANTPVIILKTNDHKVTTGAEWFKGIYDESVFLADSLDDAFNIAKRILAMKSDDQLKPYLFDKYYKNELKRLLNETWG